MIILKGRLPGLNEYTEACRKSKYAGASMKKDAEQMLCWQIPPQIHSKVITPVKVHFVWREPNLKRDADNVAFAKKFVLDALVTCGVLQGDGRKYVVGFTDEFVEGDYGVSVWLEVAKDGKV